MIFILNGASFASTIGNIPNIGNYIGSVGTGGTGGTTEPIDVKLIFNYSPTSATLTLTYNDGTSNQTKTDTGDGVYELTVKSGTSISWTLVADGYTTKSGTISMPAWNKTETQSLVSTGSGSEGDDSDSGGSTTTSVTWKSGGFQADGSLNVLTNRAHSFVKVEDASNATITGTDSVEYCLYGFSTTNGSSILGKLASFVPGSNTSSNMITALSAVISDTSKIKYIGLTGKLSSNGDISDFNTYADNFTFTGVSDAINQFTPKTSTSGGSSTSTVFEAGALLSADGTEATNNARARTINAYPIKEGTVTSTTGFQHIVYFYEDEAATIYKKGDATWKTSTSLLTAAPDGAAYYRVVVKNDAGTEITPAQAEQNTTLVL